ncbi:hypothetical protein RJ639_002449, partial [Escallonia herrerae]
VIFHGDRIMALETLTALKFSTCDLFGTRLYPSKFLLTMHRQSEFKFAYEAIGYPSKDEYLQGKCKNSQQEIAEKAYPCYLIHQNQNKIFEQFNGTPTKPRLSVFCSEKQLYATLIDDQNKKCLFYGSTLQKSVRDNPACTTIEAAERVGEELVKTCVDLNINEISSYDRNGFARGEKMQAFEIAISRHGFLSR